MSVASAASQATFSDRLLGAVQALGRSLTLPIAVLPAALLLRLGQNDIWARTGTSSYLATNGIPWIAQAGNAIFANLSMIFAVGIAIGLTGDAGAGALRPGGFPGIYRRLERYDPAGHRRSRRSPAIPPPETIWPAFSR